MKRTGSWKCVPAFALASVLLACVPALAATTDGTANFTVLLDSPSAGKRLSMSQSKRPRLAPRRAAATSFAHMARAVALTQEPVIEALAARGIEILGHVGNVLNALFVRATPEQAKQIELMQGVQRVVQSRELEFEIDTVADIVQLANTRLVSDGVRATGAGVRIAIIDSGLDFDHDAFQDDSLPELPGYPKGRPDHLPFANSKVIAVRSYIHLQNSRVPGTSTPDDESPRDSSGHGTAVAMIAAGKRVDSPVGPVQGVAPRAHLGIYKVTGTPGINTRPSTQAVIAAIDDAVTDEMDILNLSLGAPALYAWHANGRDCGNANSALYCDPLAVAAQSAVVDFGRVVVAAAGNLGAVGIQAFPAKNTILSPGVAPDVISVGATVNARRLVQSVRSGPLTLAALSGTGPEVDGSLTAPMMLGSALDNGDACNPFPAKSLLGQIVIAERGQCWFLDKIENADAAGALGVVVVNNTGTNELAEMASVENTDIPAYFVGALDGAALSALARKAGPGTTVSVTLDAAPMAQARNWQTVGASSSRGPTPGLNLKPDIAAPGLWVYSAAARPPARVPPFRPTGYRQVSGTSFAAPAVAGAAALVWQEHPELTAREVASALINTASQDILTDGEPARVTSVGGGLLNVQRALDPIATVEPPTVGFGSFTAADMPVWQEILVTNRSRVPQSYRMTVEPRDMDPRAAVTLAGFQSAEFQLHPGEYIGVRVTLDGRLPEPGSYEGNLRLSRQGGGADLLVPYLYVVGDNRPHNSFPVTDSVERGPVGQINREYLAGKFVDQFGAPLAGVPVRFSVVQGTARILDSFAATDIFGLAAAHVEYGSAPGEQVIVAAAAGFEIPFRYEASGARPQIEEIANSASLEVGRPVAPGSVITVFGTSFSEFPGEAPLTPLPLLLKTVSASFDFPEVGVSVPAPVFYVERDQVGLQVPWELAGLNFAYLKVRVKDRFEDEFTSEPRVLDLADMAPAIYVFVTDSGGTAPALQHPDGYLITAEDPARPGGAVSVLMTGNGPLAVPPPTGSAGPEPVPTVYPAEVTVGGLPATVIYSGSVPGVAGMYQVDFVVPDNAPGGDLELRVTVHGATSNRVELPVL